VDERIGVRERFGPVDPAPRDPDREDAGRPRGGHVVGGVADVRGLRRGRTEPLERQQQRIGRGLLPLGLVPADDDLEQVADLHPRERQLHRPPALRGDEPEPAPLGVQPHERLVHPGARLELVVERLVVRPVGAHELVDPVGGQREHLRLEPGPADRGHQLAVGDLPREHGARRVAHRGEDDPPGVDDGSVEVEQDDGEAHGLDRSHGPQGYSTPTR
jgi:hypothetical protein